MLKTIQNVKISAISTCVPSRKVDVLDNKLIYGGNEKKLNRVVKDTGFRFRHVITKNSELTACDFCLKAAEELFKNGIDKNEISAVIMVTQYPDYFEPSNASIIHGKLGLNDNCIAFDINQGCSGYIFGLLSASNILDKNNKKVLLLCGDTNSKASGDGTDVVDDMPIFSDGGCATIVEYDETAEPMYFEIGTRGCDYQALVINNGGYKNPPQKEMFNEDGTFNYNPYMDGLKVFEFTMNIVPPSINRVMEYAELEEKDIDYYVLHQANKMILQNIAASAKIDVDKVLKETLTKVGNLSSASVASVICDEREIFNDKKNKVVINAFGVGLSWGSVALTLNNPLVLPIIYY